MTRQYREERPDILRLLLIADREPDLRHVPALRDGGYGARRAVAAAEVDAALRKARKGERP